MKKMVVIIIGLVLLCGLLLTKGSLSVSADSQVPDLGTGSWSTGNEIAIDLEKNPAPYNYYQLVGKGVKVSKAGEICHPFRGGQFKWVGDIRHLVDGKWIKVKTTQGWIYGTESPYQICAKASDNGVYALFAYYTGPIESILPTKESSCADGLTLIGSTPLGVTNDDVYLIWNGTRWEDPIFSDWNSGFCSLGVFNTGPEPLDVVIREGNNICTTETIPAIEGSIFYSGETEEGTCPMQAYQAPD